MLTPNWFASVMGTGIVAVAAARLPEQFPGLHAAAIVLWALAGILLLALMATTVAHWVLYAANARRSFTFPVGTCVTGTTGLAIATGSAMLRAAATVFFAGLAMAWLTVAVRTARGAARGHLFLPAAASVARPEPVRAA